MVRSLRQGRCTPHELASLSRENNIVQGVTRFFTWAKRGGIWTDARVCLHYWVVIRVAGYCNHPRPPYIAQFLGYVMGRIQMALRSYSFLDISLPPIISWDQAALWRVQSVCLPVCLSVSHTILTMFPSSCHHEIFRSSYQWQKWYPCKRSRSEVKGQGHNPT